MYQDECDAAISLEFVHDMLKVFFHAFYNDISFGKKAEKNATIFCLDI